MDPSSPRESRRIRDSGCFPATPANELEPRCASTSAGSFATHATWRQEPCFQVLHNIWPPSCWLCSPGCAAVPEGKHNLM